MHIVIFGAGGVGGVIGGRLFQHADRHGNDVTLVARGDHHDAIKRDGLTVHDPEGSVVVPVPVVDTIEALALDPDDVVLLCMKTQDTPAALESLAVHAPAGIGVACVQNGVENERLALRCFADVYGVCVMLPATFLEPGVVEAHGAPVNAILDIGRFPNGTDDRAEALVDAFQAAGLRSRSDPAVLRWKYAKLLLNLANSLDALVADTDAMGPLAERARAEGEACFEAAGIDFASAEEDRARRADFSIKPIAGRRRGGGSTWQTFAKGVRTTEVDWLNGEIVWLGRQYGVPTPVNAMLQAVTREAARDGLAPRSLTTADLEARL